MDGIILAGGLGKRLRAAVSNVPKPLAPIRGTPFLDLLVAQVEAHVERIILAIGYKAEQVKEHYSQSHILFSEEETPLGTGGALKKALRLVDTSPTLVMNGDSYFDVDLEAMLRFHLESHADVTIACRQVDDVSRYGSIQYDTEQRVFAFNEKVAQPGRGWINGGIYLLNKALLEPFQEEVFSLEDDVFPLLLKKQVFAYPSEGKFIDIGTPASYSEAQEIL